MQHLPQLCKLENKNGLTFELACTFSIKMSHWKKARKIIIKKRSKMTFRFLICTAAVHIKNSILRNLSLYFYFNIQRTLWKTKKKILITHSLTNRPVFSTQSPLYRWNVAYKALKLLVTFSDQSDKRLKRNKFGKLSNVWRHVFSLTHSLRTMDQNYTYVYKYQIKKNELKKGLKILRGNL